MKIRFKYLLLVLIPYLSNTQQHWVKLENVDIVRLNRVTFLDSLNGWIAGNNGLIMKTTNSGLSWERQNSNIYQNIVELFMLNNRLGWGLAHIEQDGDYYTLILKTTNGGAEWIYTIYPEPNKVFLSIFFLDSLNGWMCGDYGMMVSTRDGGMNWSDVRVEPPEYPRLTVNKVKFFSPTFGIAVGGVRDLAAVIWRTSNGGDVWTVSIQGTEPLYNIYFKDENNIIGFGGDFEFGASIVRTSDSGLNWDYQFINIWGEGRGVSFRNPDEGFVALGYSGTYMYSTDAGENWIDVYTPDTTRVFDVSFPDQNYGFMVGDRGAVFKFSQEFLLNANAGWNLVSIPVTMKSKCKDSVFHNLNSQIYGYVTGIGYRVQDSLSNGVGYWVKFPSDTSLKIFGARRPIDSIYVKAGWNIIGSVSNPIPVSNITTNPPGIIGSNFFYYDYGYKLADSIKPFLGYWVKIKSDGYIILK